MAVPTSNPRERLLTVTEIAEQLALTEETVRRWLRSGELRGIRLSRKGGWRVRENELQTFLENRTPSGT